MKILALIPARGGSKRIPRKNSRLLGGKPLIVWSIEAALGLEQLCDVLVSTDDEAIADIARNAGALVPWLRPLALATDKATSMDVCKHALDWYQGTHGKVDGLLLLQPTSPFRKRGNITRGIDLFQSNQFRTVLGVSPSPVHPMLCFRLEQGHMTSFVASDLKNLRTQDLPPAFVVNGAFYLAEPGHLEQVGSFYDDQNVPLIFDDAEEVVDIDTEQDWAIAEDILKRQGAV